MRPANPDMYHMRNFRRVGSHHTPPPDIAHPGACADISSFVWRHITGFPSYFTGL